MTSHKNDPFYITREQLSIYTYRLYKEEIIELANICTEYRECVSVRRGLVRIMPTDFRSAK